jgi:site-specific DNA-methyltransferase (adenine-specific)
MKDLILRAFLTSRDGYSADAIIADPARDAMFLATCRKLGAEGSDFELNHCLYNLRKSRALEDYPTTRRSKVTQRDEYEFAAEIAARFLERRYNTTLDRVICDPTLAQEFDRFAQELAPGFSSFDYRFTALSLRKRRRLRPEIAAQLLQATRVESFCVADLDINRIPRSQGVYLLYYKGEGLLYLGEARNLRDRIRKHLDHSDRKDLAHWLWERGSDSLYVEIHILPDTTTNSQRKAIELDLIRSRRPRFNILGVQPKG